MSNEELVLELKNLVDAQMLLETPYGILKIYKLEVLFIQI